MDKKIVKGIILMVAFILAIAISAAAQAPNTMLYQGRLTLTNGDPITSSTSVTFFIYESEVTAVYIDSFIRTVLPDDNGVFTVELGPLSAVDFDGAKLWLGMRIGGEDLGPRQLITSVPYAFNANVGDGSITLSKLATNSVNSDKIANYSITGIDIANSTITGTKVENESLSKYDIDDEPGICRSYQSSVSIALSGNTLVDSATINVPGAGYVLALGYGYVGISGTTIGNVVAGIETSTVSIGDHSAFGFTDRTFSSSTTIWGPVCPEELFTVSSAGNYKYYFLAKRGIGTGGSATIFHSRLDLIFIPSSYGTVSALVPESEISNFEQTEAVNIDNPNQVPATMYEVDLRELELKAARAQAEAEKAERELMEAKLRELQENQEQ